MWLPHPPVSRGRRRALQAALIAFAAASGLARGGPATAPSIKVRIALPRLPHAALLHVADARGFLREEGIEATIVGSTHGRLALALLADGNADAAAAADAAFVTAVVGGSGHRIAACISTTQSESAIVARRDRGIEGPSHLAGKRIGVTFGTSADYTLWTFMIRHRIGRVSVRLVDVPPPAMAQALSSGSVDAVATWQPHLAEVRSAMGNDGIAFPMPDVNSTTFLLVLRGELLERNPELPRRVVAALLRAEKFARSRPDEALGLLAPRLGVAPAALHAMMRKFILEVRMPQSLLVTLEGQSRWAMARGFAPHGPVPNFLPYLHLDALLAADPRRVTVIR